MTWRRRGDKILACDEPSHDIFRRVQQRQKYKVEPRGTQLLHQTAGITLPKTYLDSRRNRVVALDQGRQIQKGRQAVNRADRERAAPQPHYVRYRLTTDFE